MRIFKNIMFVILGILLAVSIFCLVVLIASAINGISFTQQLSNWFASNTPVVEEVVEDVSSHFVV